MMGGETQALKAPPSRQAEIEHDVLPLPWPSHPLKQFVDAGRSICYGVVQPGKPVAGGVPIVRVNNFGANGLDISDALRIEPDIEAQYTRSRLQGGELLITLVGSVGQSAIAPPELRGWNVARAVGVVPISDELTARWVKFVFASNKAQEFFAQRANTTVQTTVNLRDLAELQVPVPPRASMEAIVSVLASLDDKIELNRRMNETLEGMAQAIFRDWFVDFGPVRRKAEGETDAVAIMGGLTPAPAHAAEFAALFPDTFGEDGLPVGWASVPVSKLISIIGGGTPKTSNSSYWNGPIPWFSVVDTPAGKDLFVCDTEKSITQAGLEGSSARLVPPGTTIISARGTVGNLALAAQEMTFNQSCYALRSSDGDRPFFTFLVAANLVEVLKGMAHGSVFSTITRQTFDGVSFADAGGAIMDAFDATVAPLFNRIRAAVDENRTLTETRDYLLPRLMSGTVRVARESEPA